MRGTDKGASPDFVKAYMHNGIFKSLKDVVHFYNKRNIAVNANGMEIAFDLRKGPPSGYTPLFPPPVVLDNVHNVTGVSPSMSTSPPKSIVHLVHLHSHSHLIHFYTHYPIFF